MTTLVKEGMRGNSGAIESTFRILGVQVDAVQIPDVVKQMEDWIARWPQTCHYIAFTGLHGVSEANKNSKFKNILNSADLVVADGMPLVWLGRLHGMTLTRRVSVAGPHGNILSGDKGSRYRHFFLWRELPGSCRTFGTKPSRKIRYHRGRHLHPSVPAAHGIGGTGSSGSLAGLRAGRAVGWFEHSETRTMDV